MLVATCHHPPVGPWATLVGFMQLKTRCNMYTPRDRVAACGDRATRMVHGAQCEKGQVRDAHQPSKNCENNGRKATHTTKEKKKQQRGGGW